MISASANRLWKLDDNQKWELFSHVDSDVLTKTTETQQLKDTIASQEGGAKKQKPSTQFFYFSKVKQEVKGSLIYTPKGYGVIQNISPEKNIISIKVNNEVLDFDRNEVSNEILIEFIHVESGGKRVEKVAFPIQATAKDISEKIANENAEGVTVSRLFYKGKELPQTNENLEKLGITPSSKILVVSSLGKFYTVNRFKQTYNGWGFGTNSFEGISFSVSKDCRIAGFGIYSPYQANGSITGAVRFVQGQSKDGAASWEGEVSISKAEDENEKIYRVMFDRPVMVKAGEIWSAVAELKGASFGGLTYYGNMGVPSVAGEGEVSFTFMQCNGHMNQTNVYSGQLPEIYYYA